MKRYLFSTFFFLFLVSTSFAQPAVERNVINFRSSAFSMCLTKSHGVCLATMVGEVAVPSDSADTWSFVPPQQNKVGIDGPTISNINFFNNDTGFVSGFIHDSSSNVYNVYYRTVNGGNRWDKLLLPDNGWVDDAINLNNGEAWLSVSGTTHIDYTVDYGATWQQLNIPKGSKERFATIFFNAHRQGFIGSLWNVLAYTPDNCKTWVSIPTPLDQHAYTKTDVNSRPEIIKLAIFKNYLLVEQEGLLFYTKKDNIRWQPLNYSDFIAGVNEDALFFAVKNLVVKVGDDLQPVKQYKLAESAWNGKYNNGVLAFWSNDVVTNIDSLGSITNSRLYTNNATVVNPAFIGFNSKSESCGYMAGKIYTQKEYKDPWVFKAALPFEVSGGIVRMISDDSVLVVTSADTLIYFNVNTKAVDKTTGHDLLNSFCNSSISTMVFEKGGSGCFFGYKDDVVYEKNNKGDFELKAHSKYGTGHENNQKGYNKVIKSSKVDEFIKSFPVSVNQLPEVGDLGLSQKDYATSKKDISDFEKDVRLNKGDKDLDEKGFRINENNIDFKLLLSLPDSIPNLPPQTVDSFLYKTSALVSTTSYWTTVKFVNDKGQQLTIENRYYEPNSLSFPWSITIDGYTVTKNPISVNNFINTVYPSFIQSASHADIIEAFVKRLYSDNDLQ